jgi:outer membrane protein OmpA-like peptidoglycan-associated protein
MKKGIRILVAIFMIMPSFTFAQLGEIMSKAKSAYLDKNYNDAIFYYNEASKEVEPSLKSLFELGMSQYHTNRYIPAERTLSKLVKKDTSFTYPEIHYYLGQVNKNLVSYGEAIEYFLTAAKVLENKNPKMAENALLQIGYCEWAMGAVKAPQEGFTIEDLKGDLNSEYALYSPRVIRDSLYFTSFETPEINKKKTFRRDLLKIERGTEDYASIVRSLDIPNKHLGHLSINTKEDKLYFSICEYTENNEANCKIFTRTITKANEIGPLEELPLQINKEGSTNSQPYVGYDNYLQKEVLYFVSDREGGLGKTDIWMSIIENDSIYSDPVNLSTINTEEEEVSPYFDNLNQRLFFSSRGHKTLGGFDILIALKNEDKWNNPVNPGLPFNSSVDDLSYFYDEESNLIYFASNRENATPFPGEEGLCCTDLFKIDVLPSQLDIQAFECNNIPDSGYVVLKYNTPYNTGEIVANSEIDSLGKVSFRGVIPGSYFAEFKQGNKILDTVHIDHQFSVETDWVLDAKDETFIVDFKIFNEYKNIRKDIKIGDISIYSNDEKIFSQKLINQNDFTKALAPGVYDVNVSFPDTTLFVGKKDQLYISGNESGCRLNKEIDVYNLPYILPLRLYFDNDEPKQVVSNPKKSSEPYNVTYFKYIDKVQEFQTELGKFYEDFSEKTRRLMQLQIFFETEVTNNYEQLNTFLEQIKLYLDTRDSDNFQLTLEISGYASPRFKKGYNKLLSERRSDSVIQYIYNYKNGLLKNYIDNSKLELLIVPYGEGEGSIENKADDEGADSIYGLNASKDRKVIIKKIKISN